MRWQISVSVADILKKGAAGEGLSHEQAMTLLALPLHSREIYALLQTADQLSRARFGPKGKITLISASWGV